VSAKGRGRQIDAGADIRERVDRVDLRASTLEVAGACNICSAATACAPRPRRMPCGLHMAGKLAEE